MFLPKPAKDPNKINWSLAPNRYLDKRLKDITNKEEALELAIKRDTVFVVICPRCECEELYLDLRSVHACLQCDNKYYVKNYRVCHSDAWAKERYGITRSNYSKGYLEEEE